VVLLHGIVKKTQTPRSADLERASPLRDARACTLHRPVSIPKRFAPQ
jgi:hypothetical protein